MTRLVGGIPGTILSDLFKEGMAVWEPTDREDELPHLKRLDQSGFARGRDHDVASTGRDRGAVPPVTTSSESSSGAFGP